MNKQYSVNYHTDSETNSQYLMVEYTNNLNMLKFIRLTSPEAQSQFICLLEEAGYSEVMKVSYKMAAGL